MYNGTCIYIHVSTLQIQGIKQTCLRLNKTRLTARLRLRDTRDALIKIVFIQRRVTGPTNYTAKDNLEEIINSLLWRNIKTVTHMEVAPGRLKLWTSSSQKSSFRTEPEYSNFH